MIVVLCIVVLLGFVALVMDVGVLFYTKRQLQSIADSAALGAASVLNLRCTVREWNRGIWLPKRHNVRPD